MARFSKRLSIIAAAGLFAAVTAPVQAGGDAAAGKKIAAACEGCHGAAGKSENPAFPVLAGQYEDYMVKALKDYRSGKRKNPIMAGSAAPLSDDDIDNLAAYFASAQGLRAAR